MTTPETGMGTNNEDGPATVLLGALSKSDRPRRQSISCGA